MMRLPSLAALAALFSVPPAAFAQVQFPTVYVQGETDRAQMRACGVNYASAIAAVEAAFRNNGVVIGIRAAFMSARAIRAYVNLIVLPVRYGSGRDSGLCTTALSFELGSLAGVVDPVTRYRHFVPIIFCNRTKLMTFAIARMQRAINDSLRDFVNECIPAYHATLVR